METFKLLSNKQTPTSKELKRDMSIGIKTGRWIVGEQLEANGARPKVDPLRREELCNDCGGRVVIAIQICHKAATRVCGERVSFN